MEGRNLWDKGIMLICVCRGICEAREEFKENKFLSVGLNFIGCKVGWCEWSLLEENEPLGKEESLYGF